MSNSVDSFEPVQYEANILPHPALDLSDFLREHVAPFSGVAEVRLLPKEKRRFPRHKVYVVLATHDLQRDERIIDLLCQWREVDYDLVPRAAVGMIPDGAVRV